MLNSPLGERTTFDLLGGWLETTVIRFAAPTDAQTNRTAKAVHEILHHEIDFIPGIPSYFQRMTINLLDRDLNTDTAFARDGFQDPETKKAARTGGAFDVSRGRDCQDRNPRQQRLDEDSVWRCAVNR